MLVKKREDTIAFLLIVIIGIILQYNYIDEFPRFIHAWAQSDRYSIALGFVNNDLNLFKPETFVLNHQFPNEWMSPSNSSITAVDFPIHEYIIAIFMKLFGSTAVWIFRVYTLIYSFVGLFFLYKLAYLVTKNYYKAVFLIVFAATSPVFVYYQSGFLPTIPSFANVVIGIYLYCKYAQQGKERNFTYSILFLTLATLNRSTCAIPLVAVLGVEFIRILQKKSTIKHKILPVILSLGSILGYIWYNGVLRGHYGSIFLNMLLPAESWEEAKSVFVQAYDKWFTHYFSLWHYGLLLVGILLVIISFKDRNKTEKQFIPFTLLVFAFFCGSIIFLIVMLKQFAMHDYYFLDTFFVPVLLLLIILLRRIPDLRLSYSKWVYSLSLILIGVPLVLNADEMQQIRRETGSWDTLSKMVNNFKGSDVFLDSLHISRDAKILVIESTAPNIPFILMKRKGYANMYVNKDVIKEMLKWDFDYIVVQDNLFAEADCLKDPDILFRLKKIADNGKIAVCILLETPKEQTVNEFMERASKNRVIEKTINFDFPWNGDWKNVYPSTEIKAFSGNTCDKIASNFEFGLTYSANGLPFLRDAGTKLVFTGYFYSDSLNNCNIVVNMNVHGKSQYYQAYDISEQVKKKNTWEKVSFTCSLPQIDTDDNELSVYIWNHGRNTLFVDDFGFQLFQ